MHRNFTFAMLVLLSKRTLNYKLVQHLVEGRYQKGEVRLNFYKRINKVESLYNDHSPLITYHLKTHNLERIKNIS